MKKLIVAVTVLCLLAAGCSATKEAEPEAVAQAADGTLTVQGLCGMCKTRIEETAMSVEGVSQAEWNGETKALTLKYDSEKTGMNAISRMLAQIGHDTDYDKADDMVYDALPDCCKYRQ